MRLQLVVVGALALGIAAVWGVRAAFVYSFFAFLAVCVVYAAAVGGDLITAVSRSRFDDRPRR